MSFMTCYFVFIIKLTSSHIFRAVCLAQLLLDLEKSPINFKSVLFNHKPVIDQPVWF